MAPPHAFKVRWRQPVELLKSNLSSHVLPSSLLDSQPSCSSPDFNLDPDGHFTPDPNPDLNPDLNPNPNSDLGLDSNPDSSLDPSLDLDFNPDFDPIIPGIQLRRTRQNVLPGIPSYFRLGHHPVILGPQDVLVPAPPQVVYSCRSARQSETVKAQALALLHCTQWPMTREKYKVVSEMTHISVRSLYELVNKARNMSYDPRQDLRIQAHYVAPIKPPGPKRTVTSKAMEKRVIALVEKNRNGREKLAEVLGFQLDGISQTSVLKMFKRKGYHKRKSTWKPLLNADQKKARLQFALRYQHWKLED